MNSFGKDHDELVEETVDMLKSNMSEDELIREGLIEFSENIKNCALNHNVLPKSIKFPVKGAKNETVIWLELVIGCEPGPELKID